MEEYIIGKSLNEIMQCFDHDHTHITACVRIDGLWFLTVVDV